MQNNTADMRCWGLLLLIVWAVIGSARSQCGVYELDCCISHFSSIIRSSGIDLSEESISRACTVREETEDCMDTFLQQCLKNGTDSKDIEDVVNKTKLFVAQICPPSSDFLTKLRIHQDCILNSSANFQTCYNKTVVPRSSETDEERMKKECCEYKDLRDCAIQTVEKDCGATASQLIHEEVVHMNGAVLETVCSDLFPKCGNSAAMLSSALFVLYSVLLLKLSLL